MMHSRTRSTRKSFIACAATVSLFMPILFHSAQAADNPYQVIYHWGELPGGRTMGVVTGVHPDPDGEHIWILERCGANQCAGSDLHPIHKLDMEGNTVHSIGAGVFAWPHGFDMDAEGNFWVTEGAPDGDARGAPGMERGMGHQVIKISQDGEVLVRLGEAGTPGEDAARFNGPAAVLVAPNGDLWIADGMSGEQWNRGWERGIRIGDARTGYVTEFIPDYEIPTGSGIEFLASDAEGNIYAGQVGRQRFEKYVRVRP